MTRKEIVKLLIKTYTKRELSALMLGLDVAEEEVTDVLETEGISFLKSLYSAVYTNQVLYGGSI